MRPYQSPSANPARCLCNATFSTPAERATQEIYALGEPWRERFLVLIAQNASLNAWPADLVPTREQVHHWLTQKETHSWVMSLLRTWRAAR